MMGPTRKPVKRSSAEAAAASAVVSPVVAAVGSTSPTDQDHFGLDGEGGDDDYQNKRARNNDAVKRSRAKAKAKVGETSERVNNLKAENEELESKIKIVSKELQLLKDMFVAHAGATRGVSMQELPGIDNLLHEAGSAVGAASTSSSSTNNS